MDAKFIKQTDLEDTKLKRKIKHRVSPLQKRLYTLLLVCLVPLTVMIIYLLVIVNRFSNRYDTIVNNITAANAYNIDFKEDMDYLMYIIVVNMDRAKELIDTEQPHQMIHEAEKVFNNLYLNADTTYARDQIARILKCLGILEDRVKEIEADSLDTGAYDKNMERLDLNIRVLTELIQEQVQEYIYYENTRLDTLREGIRADVVNALRMNIVIVLIIIVGAIIISHKIMISITEPIRKLSEATKIAGSGNFAVRAQEGTDDELASLNANFNQMVEKIGNLVEDIKTEQSNLRKAELKLMQAQINPHFLYNTLDSIIWLAESDETEQVVQMVTALSDFFRTTLNKGRDYIPLLEEEAQIRSYLQIQQFRYQDILQYEINFSPELYSYQILNLTLQPLVENALYHGIKNKRGVGHIIVNGEVMDNLLLLRVYDDGMGMSRERLEELRRQIQDREREEDESSGFGLFNVNQRLQLNYGSEYGLEIDSVYREWTTVTVKIPAIKK